MTWSFGTDGEPSPSARADNEQRKEHFDMIDYRGLRWSNLNSEKFRHLKLLLFWPVYGIFFFLAERGGLVDNFHLMYSPLDDLIPFCEYFLIPYLFWFVYLVGMILYALFFDAETFRKMMRFIIITYSAAILIYFLFPTAQNLRPASFPRDNIFARFLTGFYSFDTNTNVCPSIHVIGSVAVMIAAWNSRHFHSPGWRIAFSVAGVLISISTVFLKQHSVLDILAALPLCLAAYLIVYKRRPVQEDASRQSPPGRYQEQRS